MIDATDAMRGGLERLRDVARRLSRCAQIMEVCGTHTVSIFRHGIRSLIPPNLRLISGPGCPVCVTAQRHIDAAIRLAELPGAIVATYGDMLRVPGALGSLESRRSEGADVRVVGSTLGAIRLAREHPERDVVFVAVGFETTAPATAAAVLEARRLGLRNISFVVSHKLVVPAMAALLEGGDARLDGFVCPGHVSVIIGSEAYRPIVDRFHIPCVVAGFEPASIVEALARLVSQMSDGRAEIENPYEVAVSREGNVVAQRLLERVFEVCDTPWRALGVIPRSGLALRAEFERYDAVKRFGLEVGTDRDHPACRCGEVIQGKVSPDECELFGTVCNPLRPLGPCMVSGEGTCSAWFKYNRRPSSAPRQRHVPVSGDATRVTVPGASLLVRGGG